MENNIEEAKKFLKQYVPAHLVGGEARMQAFAKAMVTYADALEQARRAKNLELFKSFPGLVGASKAGQAIAELAAKGYRPCQDCGKMKLVGWQCIKDDKGRCDFKGTAELLDRNPVVCLHDWDEGHHGVSRCKKCLKFSA